MSDVKDEAASSQIQFHMLKSSGHRVVYVDGVFGGVSPRGVIHMALFSERFPIPQTIVHEVVGGKLGTEVERRGREGVVRDVEVSVIMRPDTAVAVARWLLEKAVAAGADVESGGFKTAAVGSSEDAEES